MPACTPERPIPRCQDLIYEDTLAKNPDCWVIQYNLGNVLDGMGRSGEAIEHYRQAIRLKPDYAEAHNNLGDTLVNVGRTARRSSISTRRQELKPRLGGRRSLCFGDHA